MRNHTHVVEIVFCRRFLKRVTTHNGHILESLLPDRSAVPYSLRDRTHNKTLIPKTTQLNDDNFLIRMLCKDVP